MVHLAVQVLRVVQVFVDAPQAVRDRARIRGRVPVGDAWERLALGNAEPLRDDIGNRDRPVVREALADRTCLLRGEAEVLRIMDRVPVLVQDDLGVLGVVDATLAEAELEDRVVGLERVVVAELVEANLLRLVVDRAAGDTEAEALDVLLRLGDPLVLHHLL